MIFRKFFSADPARVYATPCPDDSSLGEEGESPSTSGREEPSRAESPAWRHVIVASLVAEGLFLLFYLGGTFLPLLIWPGSLVFFPAGLWLGRKSRRPWMEGAFYGLLTTVAVALLLLLSGFPWGSLYALFLVLPQGILGTWLGARFFSAQSDAPR